MEWPARCCKARLGLTWHGKAGEARTGVDWHGADWKGTARPARSGTTVAEWTGTDRSGQAGRGTERPAGSGLEWQGKDWRGAARPAGNGTAGMGGAVQGQCKARHGLCTWCVSVGKVGTGSGEK